MSLYIGWRDIRVSVRVGAVLVVIAGVLAGCGDHQAPAPRAVVEIEGSGIPEVQYRRALTAEEASYASAHGLRGRRYYVPPDFDLCVRDRRRAGGRVAALRAECRFGYEGLRRSVLGSLIEARWIEQGARSAGIRLSLATVRRGLHVPNAASEAPSERLRALSNRLIDRGTRGRGFEPSPARIARYYRAHRRYFVQPEIRDALAIRAETRRVASRARRALISGASWAETARRYALAGHTEHLDSWTLGGNDPLVARAVFGGRKGELAGPVASGLDWYVLEVTRVKPASSLTLAQSSRSIADFLATYSRYHARLAYWRRFRLAARARTSCVTALKIPQCRNAPSRGLNAQTTVEATLPRRPQLPPASR